MAFANQVYRRPSDRTYQELSRVPDFLSEASFDRLMHSDIAGLADDELGREYRIIQRTIDRANRPDLWQVDRLDRLRHEIARRKRGRR